ncbi:MAG: hypothetical protein AAF405_07410 [Pseudomonadota bacterium]
MSANSSETRHELDPAANERERERDRFAGRALSFLIGLNGAAALVLLAIVALEPQATVDGKVTTAMLVFSGGALGALFSAFLSYVDRTIRLQSPDRPALSRGLRAGAIAIVILSGAAFLTGMNMVASTQAEKSSSHPKGGREDKPKKRPQVKSADMPRPAGMIMLADRLKRAGTQRHANLPML